ncbi:MAG TPA: hypothetical protein VF897_06930 [Roseiflexaceae bacterium]
MTVIFTAASDQLIVMTADSAITLEFQDGQREYDTGRKVYPYAGVGCVATWGARDHNHIGSFLERQNITASSHSIDDLANLVYQYLTTIYRPEELTLDDVGYHVAGFDRDGHPRLYHIFWGFDRPRPRDQYERKYANYHHHPPSGDFQLLYNGRNDLAETTIIVLAAQIRAGKVVRFNLFTPTGIARFSDFAVRFAAELTPEVGPPFFMWLISPDNQVQVIKNEMLCPVSEDKIGERLRKLGVIV